MKRTKLAFWMGKLETQHGDGKRVRVYEARCAHCGCRERWTKALETGLIYELRALESTHSPSPPLFPWSGLAPVPLVDGSDSIRRVILRNGSIRLATLLSSSRLYRAKASQ